MHVRLELDQYSKLWHIFHSGVHRLTQNSAHALDFSEIRKGNELERADSVSSMFFFYVTYVVQHWYKLYPKGREDLPCSST